MVPVVSPKMHSARLVGYAALGKTSQIQYGIIHT